MCTLINTGNDAYPLSNSVWFLCSVSIGPPYQFEGTIVIQDPLLIIPTRIPEHTQQLPKPSYRGQVPSHVNI